MRKRKSIAVIPVRAGSKRLPNKNIRKLGGLTLLERAINTALQSNCFVEVFVSTDSMKMRKIAENAGAKAPFLRPENLSNDTATSTDVLIHCVRFVLDNFDIEFDNICLIQATSPFLEVIHLQAAYEMLLENRAGSLSSVTEVKIPPEWMFKIDSKTNKAIAEHPDKLTLPYAALPKRYRENGAFYWVNKSVLLADKTLYDMSNHFAYVMPAEKSVDIDTLADFKYAEFLLSNKIGKLNG